MASPVTIQPSIADVFLAESSATTNWETSSVVAVTPQSAGRYRSLVSFDFSALVPAGATITVATLSFYFGTVAAGRTLTVYRLLRTDWVENQATWNIYKTGSSWTSAGALSDGNDFTSTDAATAASLASAGWQSWNVLNQVQTALNFVSGVAHFLIADVGAAAAAAQYFWPRTYGTTARRPQLYIEYTVPSGVKPNFIPFFWA